MPTTNHKADGLRWLDLTAERAVATGAKIQVGNNGGSDVYWVEAATAPAGEASEANGTLMRRGDVINFVKAAGIALWVRTKTASQASLSVNDI